MQEWICMKCLHTWSVFQFSSCMRSMSFFRHGCQWHSFLKSQTDSQMYTFPDQINSKFQSKLRILDTDDVKQKTSLFSFQGKSPWYCFMVFCSFVLCIWVWYTKGMPKLPSQPSRAPIYYMNLSWMLSAQWMDLIGISISARRVISWYNILPL